MMYAELLRLVQEERVAEETLIEDAQSVAVSLVASLRLHWRIPDERLIWLMQHQPDAQELRQLCGFNVREFPLQLRSDGWVVFSIVVHLVGSDFDVDALYDGVPHGRRRIEVMNLGLQFHGKSWELAYTDAPHQSEELAIFSQTPTSDELGLAAWHIGKELMAISRQRADRLRGRVDGESKKVGFKLDAN